MRKTVADIVGEVRVCMDEIGLNDSEFMGEKDSEALDTIIRSKIIDALTFVNGNADKELLSPDAVLADGLAIDDDMTGRVVLPDDFLRLVYARLSSWVFAVDEPVIWTDKRYVMLHDRYATGSWERPAVALSRKGGRKVLELYKAKSGDDAFEAAVMTVPKITGDAVEVSDLLGVALVYYITGLTLLTLKDGHADAMFNQALTLMGISPQAASSATD